MYFSFLSSEQTNQMWLKCGRWNVYQPVFFFFIYIYLSNCAHCGACDGNFYHQLYNGFNEHRSEMHLEKAKKSLMDSSCFMMDFPYELIILLKRSPGVQYTLTAIL